MTDTTNPQAAWPPAVRDAFWTAVNAPTYDESTAATLAFAQLLTTSTVPASAPTDWAAILRAEAEHLIRDLYPAVYDDAGQKTAQGVNRAARELLDRADDAELRRLADAVPVSGPGGAADETQHLSTADKAAALGLTDTEYRAQSHAAAVATIRAAIPGMYAHVGFRLEDVLNETDQAPPVDRCIHVKAIHDTHHHTPVTGCPWCTAATSTEA
jgi:hypothetical protein